MSIETLKQALPEYAKDLKLNLSSILRPEGAPGLTEQQLWGAAVAAAIASRNSFVQRAIIEEARQRLDETALTGAKAAAAIMGMNNVYYRFTHLVSMPDYKTMPARLRMNVIANPGVPSLDFELWSLVASAINGCGACMDSHEREVRKKGASAEAVQSAVRVASVIHAVAVALEAEERTAA